MTHDVFVPHDAQLPGRAGRTFLTAALTCGLIVGWGWFIATWTTWVNDEAATAILGPIGGAFVLGVALLIRPPLERRRVGLGLILGSGLAFFVLWVMASALIGS